ncbi:MAG: type II toxin-antitoxin system VapC family toxin [Verrucomicrobia bacterium]|jgi:PIN domain nuclease of toxin-antitoxin system|nr:type II toxin-antitoxin system VapC family toxin [Verrucomicrobiota bacterium]|tara:strand:+ start:33518 stop:33925 length:408 start_codon:yes stop_codon:yes gene_type:complete
MPKIENLVAAVFDTHVWVWSSAGDTRATLLKDFSGTAIIPAISQWEVSMLAMKGCLELLPDWGTWFSENLAPPVTLVPLTAEISTTSCSLPDFHGDPADRTIVATAIVLGIPLITADEKIIRWNEGQNLLQVIAL